MKKIHLPMFPTGKGNGLIYNLSQIALYSCQIRLQCVAQHLLYNSAHCFAAMKNIAAKILLQFFFKLFGFFRS